MLRRRRVRRRRRPTDSSGTRQRSPRRARSCASRCYLCAERHAITPDTRRGARLRTAYPPEMVSVRLEYNTVFALRRRVYRPAPVISTGRGGVRVYTGHSAVGGKFARRSQFLRAPRPCATG